MTAVKSAPAPPGWMGRLVTGLCWLYILGLAAVAGLLWMACDVWWPATILAYAPRWLFGLPLAVLAPAALLLRPRALRLLVLAALLWLWPVMDLCLPWRPLLAGAATGPRLRVLTCNIHFQQLDAAALRRVLDETQPDVVALQYWTSRFEKELFEPGAQHIHREGQLLIASRYPIRAAEPIGHPPFADRCVLEAPLGNLHFVNLHLETPRDGLLAVVHERDAGVPELEANIAQRRAQSAAAAAWLKDLSGPIVIAGDFNTTVESAIFRAYWSSYTDAFDAAGFGWGPTQITPRRTAARIDHILAGPGWRCRRCWVGPFVGSEHRPVIADLEWGGGG